MDKVTFTIDGKEIEAEKGTSVLEAALENDVYIPHLCYFPGLPSPGACRLCIVEIGGKLVTSCRTPVKQGLEVKAKSTEVQQVLRPVVEMLMADHHASCRGCSASGKCEFQKVMAYMKIDRKRLARLRPPTDKPAEKNPDFIYDPNKCVLCGICIRSCEQQNETGMLNFVGRGYQTRILFSGNKNNCLTCRKCVERCPVKVIDFK